MGIAHRLSTVRNADRIAVIGGGKVRELGKHEELMNLPSGRYRRLVDAQTLGKELDLKTIKSMLASDKKDKKDDDDSDDDTEQDKSIKGIDEDESAIIEKYSNGKEARQMAYEDWKYILIGAIGALLSGGVFPAWGVMFGLLIDLLAKLVIIREAPISNQKHQLLKRRLAGIFDRKSAILRKQL